MAKEDLDLFSGGERTVEVKGNGRIDWRTYKVKVDLKQPTECKKCGEQIWWATTSKNRRVPIEYSRERGGYVSHYDNCS